MKKNYTWVCIGAIITLTIIIRLLPHPFNFTPIAALALFGGSIISRKNWWAFILPLGGLFISDAVMEIIKPGTGFYPGIVSVYSSFAMIMLLGVALRRSQRFNKVIGFSLISSILFFLVTNFFCWYSGNLYTQDIHGFYKCFSLALPFFRNNILGDLFYNGIFFGSFYFVKRYYGILKQA